MTKKGVSRRVGSPFGNVALNRRELAGCLRRAVAALAALSLFALAAPAASAGGPAPSGKGARWTWPKNARVVVRVSDDFSEIEGGRVAVESAFKKWEAAGADGGNGSHVTFALDGEAGGGATLVVHVARGRVRAGGQGRTMMLSAPGGLFVAWTVIDRRVTDPVALSHVVAHEIGHTFGLADCDACRAGSSVMTRFCGDYNDVVSGRNAPSAVDNAAVRANGGY